MGRSTTLRTGREVVEGAIDVEANRARHQTRDKAVVRAAWTAILSKGTTATSTVLIFAIAAHALSAKELGVVAVLTTMGVFTTMGDLGLGTQLLTHIPAANARGDVAEMRRLVTTTMATLLALGSFVVVAGCVSAVVAPWPTLLGAAGLDPASVRLAVACFAVCAGASIPASVIGRVLAAMLRSSTNYAWNAVGAALSLACVVPCWLLDAPAWAYVSAILGVPVLVAGALTVHVFSSIFPELRPHSLRVSWAEARSLLWTSAPYAVINISTFIAYSIDSIVVSAILGASAAAAFSLAARLFMLVGGTAVLAGQQMWSALTDAISRGDVTWARSRYRPRARRPARAQRRSVPVPGRDWTTHREGLARIWVGAVVRPVGPARRVDRLLDRHAAGLVSADCHGQGQDVRGGVRDHGPGQPRPLHRVHQIAR